jgi:hypothetical protein
LHQLGVELGDFGCDVGTVVVGKRGAVAVVVVVFGHGLVLLAVERLAVAGLQLDHKVLHASRQLLANLGILTFLHGFLEIFQVLLAFASSSAI